MHHRDSLASGLEGTNPGTVEREKGDVTVGLQRDERNVLSTTKRQRFEKHALPLSTSMHLCTSPRTTQAVPRWPLFYRFM